MTSVLERLTGPLCDAVTERSGCRDVLVALERANLFLVPLDDRRQWYRYHHLFADVLQSHLLEELPGVAPALHRRASVWFADHGDTSQAVAHSLAGGDAARAADLMEEALPVLTRERREAELATWVRSLPEEVVRARPVLGVAFVGVLAQVSNFATVGARLETIEHSLRPHGGAWPTTPPPGVVVIDTEAYRSLPARVEMYRAALSLAEPDLAGTLTHAQAALSLTPADDGLTRAAAGALAGLAYWAGGDLAGAHAAYTESIAGLRNAGFLADVLGCSITLGDIRCVQGRLEDAMDTYRSALDLAASFVDTGPLRGTADMHVGLAGVLVERDDIAAATEHLAISSGMGDANGLPQNPYRSRVVTARLREAQGDLDEALELLDDAARVYAGDYSPNVRPVPAVRARLRLRRGDHSHAEAWVRERQLSAHDDLVYVKEYEHLTLARVLLARHRAGGGGTASADAQSLLGRLGAAAEQGDRGGSLIEVLALTALARHARGDVVGALHDLGRAVDLAQPEGYVRLFADEGPPMAVLLRALEPQAVARAYVRRLLAASEPAHRREALHGLLEPLSARELEVLTLLGTDLSGPDIARQLFLSLNTVRTHTKNIYAKLGVSSRRAAVTRADDLGLLSAAHRR
jgi:LuxR family maltose regulon positive regulatory protein